MNDKLLSQRAIFIFQDIDKNISQDIIQKLLYLDSLNHEDITIYICNYGGLVSYGIAIYNTIKAIKSDVCTTVLCASFSSATIILVAGTRGKRFAMKNSFIHMHQISQDISANTTDMAFEARHMQQIQKTVFTILADNTYGKCNYNKINRMCNSELYLNAEEALKLNFIDAIIDKLPPIEHTSISL